MDILCVESLFLDVVWYDIQSCSIKKPHHCHCVFVSSKTVGNAQKTFWSELCLCFKISRFSTEWISTVQAFLQTKTHE